MDYKKKYEDAVKKLGKFFINNDDRILYKHDIESVFPELKESESENERIRKWLIEMVEEVRKANPTNTNHNGNCSDAIAWLEKQGEQKPADKVEPKFKAGDFIINEYGFIMQIDGIDDNMYVYHVLDDNRLLKHNITKTNESCHLWTTQDAKDGDILSKDNIPFIFKTWDNNNCIAYCGITDLGLFKGVEDDFSWCNSINIHPATKEQRDLLFQKMHEAGYEWDAEKKELRKIKERPDFCHHEVDLSDCSEEYRKGYYDGWNNCNQQHSQLKAEQKPAWSEEDDRHLSIAIQYVFEHGYLSTTNWLKNLKERIKGE